MLKERNRNEGYRAFGEWEGARETDWRRQQAEKTVKNVRGIQRERGLDSVLRMGGCAATMQKTARDDLNAHMRSQMISWNNGL